MAGRSSLPPPPRHPSGRSPPASRTYPGFLGPLLSSLTGSSSIPICVSLSLEVSGSALLPLGLSLTPYCWLLLFISVCLSTSLQHHRLPSSPGFTLPTLPSLHHLFLTSSIAFCLSPPLFLSLLSLLFCLSLPNILYRRKQYRRYIFPYVLHMAWEGTTDVCTSVSYGIFTHLLPHPVPGEPTLLLCKPIIFPVSSAAPLPERPP